MPAALHALYSWRRVTRDRRRLGRQREKQSSRTRRLNVISLVTLNFFTSARRAEPVKEPRFGSRISALTRVCSNSVPYSTTGAGRRLHNRNSQARRELPTDERSIRCIRLR
jgi:hypothetical protein